MKPDIAAILARAEAATAGPWGPYVDADLEDDPGTVWGVYRAHVSPTTPELTREDAAFIAAARSDVPQLCARVTELEAALRLTLERHDQGHSPCACIEVRAALEGGEP